MEPQPATLDGTDSYEAYYQPRFVNDLLYFEICCEHIVRFDEAEAALHQLDEEASAEEYQSVEYFTVIEREIPVRDTYNRSGTIVIIFAAMCLEALIYDFGARHTSDSYFKKYLDKLDPVSKWVVVPRIVVGKSIDTETQAFQMLRKLFSGRNELVHSKSRRFPQGEELVAYLEKASESFPEQVRNAVQAVFAITSELKRFCLRIARHFRSMTLTLTGTMMFADTRS